MFFERRLSPSKRLVFFLEARAFLPALNVSLPGPPESRPDPRGLSFPPRECSTQRREFWHQPPEFPLQQREWRFGQWGFGPWAARDSVSEEIGTALCGVVGLRV